MKKFALILLIVICVFAFVSCRNKSIVDYDLYCFKINKLIKDINFDKGSIDEGKIVLYDDRTEVYNQIYEDYDENFKIKYICKEDNKVFFVLNASVDDDDGIVFVNDDVNNLMDGLWSLERINGNSYKYKTHK